MFCTIKFIKKLSLKYNFYKVEVFTCFFNQILLNLIYFCVSKAFLKNLKFFYFFLPQISIFFLCFHIIFDALITKIILKK